MNIAVFCSANNNIAPDYFRAAEELGTMDWKERTYACLWWSQQWIDGVLLVRLYTKLVDVLSELSLVS